MNKQKRWVILEHIGAPDDPVGRHFDLLLEDGNSCRAWRLTTMLVVDGPVLEAAPLPPHRLEWLEIKTGLVSGDRGLAKQVMAGLFYGSLPKMEGEALFVELSRNGLIGSLEIINGSCQLRSKL